MMSKLIDLFREIDPRMVFGFGILIVIAALAVVIALGTVRMETSYGLNIVLGSLATLAGGFAQWAFSSSSQRNGGPKPPPPSS